MLQLPPLVALALVATIGYFVGRQSRAGETEVVRQSRRELRRARAVIGELERIGRLIHSGIGRHQSSLRRFKERVGRLENGGQQQAWRDLCQEAEELLQPTMRLAAEIADAYDRLRQQSAHLMGFTELRSDPLTGVSNRRAFDEAIAAQFALRKRYNCTFALAIFDIDHFKRVNDEHGHLEGDRILQEVARLFDETVRETDIVARYGGEEFVVIMPQTDLDGAGVFGERLRVKVEQQFAVTVSGGVASATDGDTPQTLLARADAALYQAKTAGRNCVFSHDGQQIKPVAARPLLAEMP